MRKAEVAKMERQELAYTMLICKMTLYKESLEKVALIRKKNTKGRYFSLITCYLTDVSGNIHAEKFRLYDEEYLWFLCAIQEDFEDVEVIDLTAEEDKVVKDEV